MKKLLLVALFMLTLSSTFAQNPVALGTLNKGKHFKIVMVAEGYTSSQMSTFLSDAQTVKTAILGLAPFDTNTSKINFYTVSTVSQQSGQSDLIAGTTVNTYWKVSSGNSGLPRFLKMPTTQRNLIESNYGNLSGGNKVFVLVICNKDSYAGYGDLPSYPSWSAYDTSLAIVNADSSFLGFLAMHEFAGHSFGDLDDEYLDATYAASGDPFLSHPDRLNIRTTNPGGWFAGARYVPTKFRFGDGLMKAVAYDFHSLNEGLVQDRINDEDITIIGTSFYMSKNSGHISNVCDISMFSVYTKYHNGTGYTAHVGDYIYNDIHGNVPFNGGNTYWKVELIPNDYVYLKISTVGEVLIEDECLSGGFPR